MRPGLALMRLFPSLSEWFLVMIGARQPGAVAARNEHRCRRPIHGRYRGSGGTSAKRVEHDRTINASSGAPTACPIPGLSNLQQFKTANSTVYMEIEDNGSPVTIFAIAGMAARIGMVPPMEFRKSLRESGGHFNVVFMRDLQRLYYHVTPEGKPGGLEFWRQKIEEVKTALGSTYCVSLGCSMGGGAALYFGAVAQMQQVLAFGPTFLDAKHGSLWNLAGCFANLPLLIRSPIRYLAANTQSCFHTVFHRRFAVPSGRKTCSGSTTFTSTMVPCRKPRSTARTIRHSIRIKWGFFRAALTSSSCGCLRPIIMSPVS